MLNQAFTADNFEKIFDIENRKGMIQSLNFSEEYNLVLSQIKDVRAEIKTILRLKKIKRTTEENEMLTLFEQTLNELIIKKKEIRNGVLESISKSVNSKKFSFKISPKDDDKFIIDKSRETFFAAKQLQYNIRKTFNVKQASRHAILSQIKMLLNESFPKYIIRTDVTSFFESIPQKRLLSKLENNTLLNTQSKKFIKQILLEYNKLKDIQKINADNGVPRGVGISSYLSELYMKDIDNSIRNLNDVIYYARYVDDIFIVISPKVPRKSVSDYFAEVKFIVEKEELSLKPEGDEKCNLIELIPQSSVAANFVITYLGYKMNIVLKNKGIKTTFGISDRKKTKIKDYISKSIEYFNSVNKHNIKKAKKELFLCLLSISTNTKLNGSKNRVKAGIFYSHDLIDQIHYNDLTEFDDFLNRQYFNPHFDLFEDQAQVDAYVLKLRNKILQEINFEKGFKEKRFHTFLINEMKVIKRILK